MRTEKALAFLAIIGISFRLLQWKGADILTLVSFLGLWVIYFFFAFYFFTVKSIKKQNLPLSIISGVLISSMPTGILFRLLHWKGGDLMLICGIYGGLIALIAILVWRKEGDLRKYYNNMLKRTIVLLTLSVLLFFTPVPTLYKIQDMRNPELANLKIRHYYNPGDTEIRDSLDNFYRKNH